ncbi:unnamed protein product [Urochloa decumbens]|uniref:UspA domain-containing protein n=1 Tax=Urochloa decumbens TaxID=240449 RepID=A0ABC9ERT6_9POAL
MQAPATPSSVDLPLAAPPPVKAPTPRPPPPASLQPESPGVFFSAAAAALPSGSSHRRIAIAVDLSDESAYAVRWSVANYLRPGDAGFGAARRTSKGRLGSVSDYCVHHCICPVVVVRFPDDGSAEDGEAGGLSSAVGAEDVLHPVPEEEAEYHDATEEHKDT